jgi:hypothetical protein
MTHHAGAPAPRPGRAPRATADSGTGRHWGSWLVVGAARIAGRDRALGGRDGRDGVAGRGAAGLPPGRRAAGGGAGGAGGWGVGRRGAGRPAAAPRLAPAAGTTGWGRRAADRTGHPERADRPQPVAVGRLAAGRRGRLGRRGRPGGLRAVGAPPGHRVWSAGGAVDRRGGRASQRPGCLAGRCRAAGRAAVVRRPARALRRGLALGLVAALLSVATAQAVGPRTRWFTRSAASLRFVALDSELTYGPLQGRRSGATLLEVTAAQPALWRMRVLSLFTGPAGGWMPRPPSCPSQRRSLSRPRSWSAGWPTT